MLDALPFFIALIDNEGTILKINRSWGKFNNQNPISAQFKVGNNYIEISDKAGQGAKAAKEISDGIKSVIAGKVERFKTEYEYAATTGKKWFRTEVIPLFKDKQNGVVIIHIDITDRKRSEQVFFELYKRYEMISLATNDAIWDWNLLTSELYWNESYFKTFGHLNNTEEVNIEIWKSRIHPEDRDKTVAGIEKVINSSDSKGFWEAEYRYIKGNNTIAYVYDRGYVVYNKENNPVRMVGAMQDVTQRKMAELERERITNDLIQHNKELQQFSYIVSHNLRGPVANILGCLDVLENVPLDDESKKQFNNALSTSVKKLDNVIKDLNIILQVKRDVDQGREEVFFSSLVEDIVNTMPTLINKEEVSIKTNFDDAKSIFTVKSYLHSIFYNLIVNSIKYKKAKSQAIIQITSKRNGNELLLSFKDNGIGIDLKDKQDKIFGLYKRFHEDSEGKGMGLFMVKNQVESLGGKVSINSEVNKGTEIQIVFNLKK